MHHQLPCIYIFGGFDESQGQICVAGTRVFVQEGIYDKFVGRLLEELKTWVVGDPFDPNVNQGPQVYILLNSYMHHHSSLI